MNWLVILFRTVIVILSAGILVFNALLYQSFERQKSALDAIKDKQDVESEFNSNKFKYQEEQIERLSKGLRGVQQQIKDQKESLGQQQDEDKTVQASLEDVKAEADATKESVQNWQKDYASVLAVIEKKIDDTQGQIKALDNNLAQDMDSLKAGIDKTTPAISNQDSTSENKP